VCIQGRQNLMSSSRGTYSALELESQYAALTALPEIWPIAAHRFGSIVALNDPHHKPAAQFTYAELWQQIQRFAIGMQQLGVKPGDRICLFSDNSARWFIADQGIMTAGGVDVVRGSEADPAELAYILSNSESSGLVVEDLATLKKLMPLIGDYSLSFISILSDEIPPKEISALNFAQILELGTAKDLAPVTFQSEQLATLLYTSGTTGQPKGVRLCHRNLMHQINTFADVLQPVPGDRVLSILPTWHCFGRAVEYYLLSHGCAQTYTSIRHIKKDMQTYPPCFMASVPRLWESLYEGIQKQFRDQPESKQKLVQRFFMISDRYIRARRIAQRLDIQNLNPSVFQIMGAQLLSWLLAPLHVLGDRLVYAKVRDALGGQFKVSVSGGGSLPMHIENFYEIVGINLLVGYGLTETSPVLTVRRLKRNLRRSAGQPLAQTELRIVDPETRKVLPLGQKGLVLSRGPQVMQGYYNNPAATAKAIDEEGWFDTGDLGLLTAQSDLILTGRAKDTIVLSNGENIEPQPLEDACVRSPFIDQIMVVGQDQRSLGALIVPNLDALQQWVIPKLSSGMADPNPDNTVLLDALSQWFATQDPDGVKVADKEGKQTLILDGKVIQDLYRQELIREIQDRPGVRPDDRIGVFQFVLEPFSIENGLLTQTLKVKRPVVVERYRDMIDKMFS
jgi:long-chain acyl-CoA synthetase